MEDKIICSDCGAELDADVSICPECGNPIKRQRKRSSGSLKPSKNFYAVILILLYSLSLIINLAKGVGINTIIQGIGIVALIVNVYFKKDSISDISRLVYLLFFTGIITLLINIDMFDAYKNYFLGIIVEFIILVPLFLYSIRDKEIANSSIVKKIASHPKVLFWGTMIAYIGINFLIDYSVSEGYYRTLAFTSIVIDLALSSVTTVLTVLFLYNSRRKEVK